MGRQFRYMLLTLLLAASWSLSAAESNALQTDYFGNYRLGPDHVVGVNEFVTDGGERVALLADYSSGVVRRLFADADEKFVMGPGFNTAAPTELTVDFVKDSRGSITGLNYRPATGPQRFAERVPLQREDVSFRGAESLLAGTLITPRTKGPHPAIILLHGSGPLTRHSFGPYPHFFASLGLAVLIYDKRGTGQSSGIRMDASTAIVTRPTKYPDDLADDALAAMRLLQGREDIDPQAIGFWGSSEGGMLATYVAARAKDTAFAINSSGFMEPLWKTLQYQVRPALQSSGRPQATIERQADLVDLWIQVARTGRGWETFQQRQREVVATDKTWFFQTRGTYASVEQMQLDWDRILSFDPLPPLANVTCPVLGVFGELDTATPAARAAENMRRVLTQAGHKDFETKIFANAGHSLAELPAKSRMAPGVFPTLRSWVQKRVTVAKTPD